MENLQLLADLHLPADRQGPGGEAETRRAIELAGLSSGRDLKIADIGCGTGAWTLVLARVLDASIVAVDLLPEFLETLQARAAQAVVAVEELEISLYERYLSFFGYACTSPGKTTKPAGHEAQATASL